MGYSKTAIANMALQSIGANNVLNITDQTREAELIRSIYDLSVDSLLKLGNWSFAIRRLSLAASIEKPAFDFEYQFELPSDCIKPIEISDKQTVYKIEGSKLLADEPVIKLRYLARVSENEFTSEFAETLAAKLASEIAFSITSNATMAERAMMAYKEKLANSRSVNSQQGTPREPDEFGNTWLSVRY